ncbi:MAG: PspC domain-containing protein [Ferruginibacter sp.]|nr:PspC domain-containing protein [Ferruginibacter sp.]
MKQVININFHGQVVPIEVSAFELLKNYTDSLSRYFATEEGKEEIINDIESRIGELFQERLKKGATCITDDDVNAIIKSMGRPEEFEEADDNSSSRQTNESQSRGPETFQAHTGNTGAAKRLFRNENDKVIAGVCGGLASYFNLDPIVVRIIFLVFLFIGGTGFLAYLIIWIAVPSTASTEIGSTRKKLFRDPDNKIISGVCSGIGNYFGVSAWIPRALFLLPFLSFVFRWSNWGFMDFPNIVNFTFSPGSLIVYIILWLVIPEAANTAEKLEMKGEKVDLNSIKNSVVGEMKGVQQRAEKFGQEAKAFAEEKGKVMGAEVRTAAKRTGRSLGDIIVLLIKIFAYFIIGCVSFGLVMALFALAIFSIGIFPLKDFVVNEGWQNIFAWGTLLFFIAVPVIGIITWIIRRLAKMKSNRKILRFTFISLWIIGWVCFFALISFVGRDFKSTNNISEQEIYLSNPSVRKLELTTNSPLKKYYRNKWFTLEPFEGVDDDTAFVKNVEIKILKSPNDSFRVTMLKMVNGRNRRFADTLANLINYNGEQKDSLFILDKGIAITRQNKFRNQRVIVTVYVPVGKQIRIDKSVGWGNNVHFGGPWNDDNFNIDFDDEERGWESNVNYVMRTDGLYTLDGEPADGDKNTGQQKVKIGRDGIEINDNRDKILIDKNGIKINESTDGYRYDNSRQDNTPDSMKLKLEKEQKRMRDSLEKAKENIDKQLEKIDVNNKQVNSNDSEALSSYQLQSYLVLVNID